MNIDQQELKQVEIKINDLIEEHVVMGKGKVRTGPIKDESDAELDIAKAILLDQRHNNAKEIMNVLENLRKNYSCPQRYIEDLYSIITYIGYEEPNLNTTFTILCIAQHIINDFEGR